MPLQPLPDYSIGLPDPAEASRKNLEFGMGLMGAQQSIQQNQQRNQLVGLQIQEAQRQQTERQTLQARLAALAQNPDPRQIAAITFEHPELTDGLWKSYEAQDANSQKAQLSVAQKIHFASLTGKPEVAVKVALDEAQASENSGDTKRAADLRGMAKQLEENPGRVDTLVGAFISRVKGADDYLKTFGNIATNQKAASDATTAAAQAKYANQQQLAELGSKNAATASSLASAANSRDAIADRAAGRALAKQEFELKQAEATAKKEAAAQKLDPTTQKTYVAAVSGIQPDRTKAAELEALADGFLERKDRWFDSGGAARFGEFLKGVTGGQNDVSQLRNKYIGERNAAITRARPPGSGPMTDNDFNVAAAAFPSPNANPEVIADQIKAWAGQVKAGLRAKLATAEWISANRSVNPATKAFKVQGVEVEPGTTLDVVIQRVEAAAEAKAARAELARRKAGASSGR